MSRPLGLVALADPHERSAIASLVWSLGLEVRQVSSGAMALRVLRRGRPVDLVVANDPDVERRAAREHPDTRFLTLATGSLDEVEIASMAKTLLGERVFQARI